MSNCIFKNNRAEVCTDNAVNALFLGFDAASEPSKAPCLVVAHVHICATQPFFAWFARSQSGGAISLEGASTVMTIQDSSFQGNTGDVGCLLACCTGIAIGIARSNDDILFSFLRRLILPFDSFCCSES